MKLDQFFVQLNTILSTKPIANSKQHKHNSKSIVTTGTNLPISKRQGTILTLTETWRLFFASSSLRVPVTVSPRHKHKKSYRVSTINPKNGIIGGRWTRLRVGSEAGRPRRLAVVAGWFVLLNLHPLSLFAVIVGRLHASWRLQDQDPDPASAPCPRPPLRQGIRLSFHLP